MKYNKLVVIEESNPEALTQVELSSWMTTETVDFITHDELTKYVDDKSDSILDYNFHVTKPSQQVTNLDLKTPKDPNTPGMEDRALPSKRAACFRHLQEEVFRLHLCHHQ